MTFNSKMHERNIYKTRPDFAQLATEFPLFRKYAIPNDKGKVRVDFSDTESLRMLTTVLLKKDFDLDVEIPPGFLIPTIPQRLNYILWVEDLLARIYQGNETVLGVDIGTGPCAIFSLLGAKKNGWKFIATESSDDALQWAEKNIERNKLISKIKVVKVDQDSILKEILSADEACYAFCLCNPPFFENLEEIRKKHHNETVADVAQVDEIVFKGGELEFVRNIVKDSLIFKQRIRLFTSMFGKKSSFLQILKELKDIQGLNVTTTEFCQGNTVRWGIAWTFDDSVQFEEVKKKVKSKKAKPPLEYQIPIINPETFKMSQVLSKAQDILNHLKIPVTTVKSSNSYAELLLKSDKNTWTHQRRMRREIERQNKISKNFERISFEDKSVKPANDVSSTDILDKIVCGEGINADLPIATVQEGKSNDPAYTSALNAISSDTKEEVNSTTCNQASSCNHVKFAYDLSPNKKRKLDASDEDLVQNKKINFDESSDTVHGTVLYCKLQLIKGKNNVYVKMNCSPEADRNSMYQVFQLVKNELK